MIIEKIRTIGKEMNSVLEKIDQIEVEILIGDILKAKKIVGCGAGRVGMATRAFIMRLGHLGKTAYFIGDTTVPSIGNGDLFLVASGSGETESIYDLTKIAKNNWSRIAAITGNPESRIGKLADTKVIIHAPSKTKPVSGLISAQPMTTLNEQCLGIFFDALVLELMDKTGETHDTMWARHSNLE